MSAANMLAFVIVCLMSHVSNESGFYKPLKLCNAMQLACILHFGTKHMQQIPYERMELDLQLGSIPLFAIDCINQTLRKSFRGSHVQLQVR